MDSARIYRWLLKLYPAQFREEYAGPMERQFRDDFRDAGSLKDRVLVWNAALWDVATHAPRQFAREAWQDFRYTLRVYRKQSMSGLLAAAALALAIGASTGVFSVVSAVMLRSLPFQDASALVEIWRGPVSAMKGRAGFTAWQGDSAYLRGAATFSTMEANLGRERDALRVKAAETSANLFALLGTKPVWGRTFAPDEDVPGKTGVAVIAHSLWQQAFGGDPGVLGRIVRVNGSPVEIIGVAPPRFDYPDGTAVWIPSVFEFERIPKRGAFLFRTVARLSASHESARSLFEAEVAQSQPEALKEAETDRPKLIPLQRHLAGPLRDALWVLMALVSLVLLAACANVAQLLLSRAAERREEFGMRSALGASRARLVQQLVTEALTLTVSAAVAGLFVAHEVCRLATLVAPAQLAVQEYTLLDWRVALFAAGLAVTIGMVFGVAPALTGWHKTEEALRRSTAVTVDRSGRRLRWTLVALQAGLTLTLAAASIATGRAFMQLLDADLGFTPANAVTLKVSLHGTSHDAGGRQGHYYAEALRRLREVPGVESAGAVSYLPLATQAFVAGGLKLDSGQALGGVQMNGASHGYFRAVGTPFVAGRDFRAGEAERVVIVNEAFADATGLGVNVVDRRVISSWTEDPYRIVGVAKTARFAGPSYPGGPQVYFRMEEEPPPALTLVARVRGNAEASVTALRATMLSMDRAVPVYDVKTLERRLDDNLERPRIYTLAALFLGGLAILIALAGIYGSAARSVAQRRREMGIRMAVGATSGRVRLLVMREVLAPVAIGVTAGVAGALATGRYVQHLIANAEPMEPVICALAAVLLIAIACVAAWRATARVLAIDPAEAVRVE